MKGSQMESRGGLRPSMAVAVAVWWWWLIGRAVSDPQIYLLNMGCSSYNVTNISDFNTYINATFSDLRTQLKNKKLFATADRIWKGESTLYTMVQCKYYMSTKDCLACFAAAQLRIRSCGAANGARVIYDGCFLRYESNSFYDQTTLLGNTATCGYQTATQPAVFQAAVEGLMADLAVATPRINGFYTADKRKVAGGGGATVYGVAQCVETATQTDCKECLQVARKNIRSCIAHPNTNGRAIDAGCFMRYSDVAFFGDNQTTDITPFLQNGILNKKAILGGGIGGVGLVLIAIVLLLWYRLLRKPKPASEAGDLLSLTELQGPVSYSYRDLQSATMMFSEKNKLGQGGFGGVYKGRLKDGKLVAVKKLFIGQTDRDKANFESEAKLISNVHHRNLIRLLGCSRKNSELLLVYEFLENGSLDKFLFGERRGTLNWKQRYNIIAGIARGLAYLHEEFHSCIIHRDIKPSNILLDDEFQPKIADFGLARLLPEDQSHVNTNFAGTFGYTAPEYALHGQLSERVDTYSYGVVVLEIISGRMCSDMKADHTEFLLEQAWKLYENDNHLELVDSSLEPEEYDGEEMKKVIEMALSCTQPSASMRPTMSEIVFTLCSKGALVQTPPPTRPAFIYSISRAGEDIIATALSYSSNASASFSGVSGRQAI